MPDVSEKAALHQAVDQLAQAVDAMARRHGLGRPIQRLVNDVERLRWDAADCDTLGGATAPSKQPLQVVSDTPYDESLWHGADDEGVGGFRTPGRR